MKFKQGDTVYVEYYGEKVYGQVVEIKKDQLRFRNELNQIFSAPLAEVQPAEPEMVDYFAF